LLSLEISLLIEHTFLDNHYFLIFAPKHLKFQSFKIKHLQLAKAETPSAQNVGHGIVLPDLNAKPSDPGLKIIPVDPDLSLCRSSVVGNFGKVFADEPGGHA